MERRFLINDKINERLSGIYKSKTINGIPFFLNNSGIPFRVCTLNFGALVIEYADTWEDGDCFFVDEMTEDEIFEAMLKEIEG